MSEHDEPAFGIKWKAQFMRCHIVGILDWAIPLQLTYEVVHPDEASHVSRHTGGCAVHAVTMAVLELLEHHGLSLAQSTQRINIAQDDPTEAGSEPRFEQLTTEYSPN